jgi:hypothetical protein
LEWLRAPEEISMVSEWQQPLAINNKGASGKITQDFSTQEKLTTQG